MVNHRHGIWAKTESAGHPHTHTTMAEPKAAPLPKAALKEWVNLGRTAIEAYPGKNILKPIIDPGGHLETLGLDTSPNPIGNIERNICPGLRAGGLQTFVETLKRVWAEYDHEEFVLVIAIHGAYMSVECAPKPWVVSAHDHCACGVRRPARTPAAAGHSDDACPGIGIQYSFVCERSDCADHASSGVGGGGK